MPWACKAGMQAFTGLSLKYATSVWGSPDSARDWIYGSPGERVFVGFESYDHREATAG